METHVRCGKFGEERMILDSRIIEGKKPLDGFDVEIAKQFIGKKGYFAHYIDSYTDLKYTVLGTLGSTGDTFHESFVCTEETFDNYDYEFFIPAEWVKEEPKYRPYTLNEFVSEFSLGDEIIVRLKDKERISHKLFVEYDENDDDNMVCLGSIWYELTELYDSFEIYTGEGWKPFGVKE